MSRHRDRETQLAEEIREKPSPHSAYVQEQHRVAFCALCNVVNIAPFHYCQFCGTQPHQGTSIPRDPQARPIAIDVKKLGQLKAAVLLASNKKRGQQRKCAVAGVFDAFILSRSGGRWGWATATDVGVFDWLCWLDSQGNGTKSVHAPTCTGIGSPAPNMCLKDRGCARRYAAGSIDNGYISKVRMAMSEQ